jgi:hypothetical protein
MLTLASEFGRTIGSVSVVSVFAISYGVLQLVYGPLGDRIGKLRAMAIASAGCGSGGFCNRAPTLEALIMPALMVRPPPASYRWRHGSATTCLRTSPGTLCGCRCNRQRHGRRAMAGRVITDALGWRYAFALTVVFRAAWPISRDRSDAI